MLKIGSVLIVDDNEMNAALAFDTLQEAGYKVKVVSNAMDGMEFVRKKHPDIVLMDIIMTGISGDEATLMLKTDPATSDTRIIIVSAKASPADIVKGFKCKADDYLTKPYYPQVLLARVKTQMIVRNAERMLLGEKANLERQTYKRTLQLQQSYEVLFISLARAVEIRNPKAGEHMKRMGEYVRVLATELQKLKKYRSLITDEYINVISWAAQIHDIGKIGIPDAVLCKEEWTEDEREILKKHTIIGGEIFSSTINQVSWQPPLQLVMCRDIALYHHEKYNGTGYPEKLIETEIPLSARLVSLVDVYEEDCHCNSCLKKNTGTPHEKVTTCDHDHFDPDIVKAYLANRLAFERIHGETYGSTAASM